MLRRLVGVALLLSPAHGFDGRAAVPRARASICASLTPGCARAGALFANEASTFKPLAADEKVALVRVVRNESYYPAALAGEDTADTWATIKGDFPDLAGLSAATLDAAAAELLAMDVNTPLPSPTAGDGGVASGAVPIALLALVVIFGFSGLTGGDLLCGAGSLVPGCTPK